MPIFDYQCPHCKCTSEYLVPNSEYRVHCFNPSCIKEFGVTACFKLPSNPSIKIKGARAANGYGLKFEDSYGRSPVNDTETGCSFSSNRGGPVLDHNFKQTHQTQVQERNERNEC